MSRKLKLKILFVASVCAALLAVFNLSMPLAPKAVNDPQTAIRQLYSWDTLVNPHF